MATTIMIRRTNSAAPPANLAEGELVYVGGADTTTGERLFVGQPSGATGPSTTTDLKAIGGFYYTRLLDHTPGILTADSAVIVDADKKINEFYVDELTFDGNTVSTASGNLTLDSTGGVVEINDNLTVSGTSSQSGAVTMGSTLEVDLGTTLKSTLDVTGAATMANTLGVTGATTLGNTLGVTGATTLGNTLGVTGATTLGSTLGVTGAATMANTLEVDLGTTLKSTLQVDGITTINNNMTVTSFANINNVRIGNAASNEIDTSTGNLVLDSAGGEVQVDDDLRVEGNTKIVGNLDVDTDVVVGINNTQTMTVNSSIGSNLIPSTHDTYDLGSETHKWSSLYAENVTFGDVQIAVTGDNIIDTKTMDLQIASATGHVIIAATLAINGDVTMGADLDVTGVAKAASVFAEDLTSSRVVVAGPNGLLGDDPNFRYFNSTTTLQVDELRFDNGTVTTDSGNLTLDSSSGETEVNDNLTVNGTADVTGAATLGDTVDITGATTMADTLGVTGHSTLASTTVEDLTATRVTFAGTDGRLEDSGSFTFDKSTGNTTITGEANIDDIKIDENTIESKQADQNINLTPNGQGTVIVPSGYEFRSNFTSNSVANKAYVDQVAQGLDVKAAVRLATTVTDILTATYAEPTLSGTGTLVIDGESPSAGDRVLIMSQADPKENGIYDVTSATGSNWVLTRSADADNQNNHVNEVSGGVFVFVEKGASLFDSGFVATHEGEPTLGTDAITFVQFSGAGSIEAGDAMTKLGNRLDVRADEASLEVSIADDYLRVKAQGIQNSHILDGTIDLTAKVQNQLDVIHGGTGLASITSKALMYGDGVNDVVELATPVDADSSYMLKADASGTPIWTNTLDGGTF
jgi:hypothetical protein